MTLPSRNVTVRMKFAADEPKPATGGEVTLYVYDEPVGSGRMEHTVPVRAIGKALANAVKKSVAQIYGTSAKELKAGLAEAQAGMGD
jgi:hypothetical protein